MQLSKAAPSAPDRAHLREKEALRSSYSLKFRQKRRNGSDRSLPSVWRRTWDSNPRGCYTLLDFQSSSLATRSTLYICPENIPSNFYYYNPISDFCKRKIKNFKIFSADFPAAFEKTADRRGCADGKAYGAGKGSG